MILTNLGTGAVLSKMYTALFLAIFFLVGVDVTYAAPHIRHSSLNSFNATYAPVIDIGYSLNRAHLVQVYTPRLLTRK